MSGNDDALQQFTSPSGGGPAPQPAASDAPLTGPASTEKPLSGVKGRDYTVRVEQISNGWILDESWWDGAGNYQHHKTYSAQKPKLKV